MSGEDFGRLVGGDFTDFRNCVAVALGMSGLILMGVFHG